MRFRSSFLVVAMLFLAFAGSAHGDIRTIPVSDYESGIDLLERTGDALVFRVTLGELTAVDVETPEGTFSRLILPRYHYSRDIGEPELPMVNRLFEIPFGAELSVEAVDYETREIVLADFDVTHPLMPAQPSVFKNQDPETLPFHYDRAAYVQAGWYGPELARVVDTGRMRGVRIGRLEVAPVSYDPQAGTIRVRNSIEIVVRFRGADHQRDAELKARTYTPFFEPAYRMMAGYRGLHDTHPDLMDGPVTYVIVSDRIFESQLGPFIQWKTEQGFKVIEGYTDEPEVGNTTTSITNYLHDLYNSGTPENPAPTFVLFVGDVAQIPAFNLSGYSDLPYCDVTGDDIPEMYYGRFSANNPAELQPQIDKTLEYEKHQMPNPSFLGESVLIAGVDGTFGPTHGNGQINYGTRHYFNLAHGILSHTYLYPESGTSDELIIADVSNGCMLVNYTAHGSQTSWSDPTFTMSDVDGLLNNHEYCLAIGNCCLTSSFQVTTCFAEHWLRVADKGAIGYIGGSESTLWDEDYYWSVGYGPVVPSGADYEETGLGDYDGMFHDHGEGIGQWYVVQDAHIFCGNLAVQESGSYYTDYYWEIYNLMGDPSLAVYFGVPDANAVSLPDYILPTTTEVEVTAQPESYVGFTSGGVLLGGGLVGPGGTSLIPISGQELVSEVHVVVTCQNKVPYTADVPVFVPEGPYLVLESNLIDDGTGDGDGAVDAGESIELVTSLRNVGNQPATTVVGVLTEVRDVVITDDTETWGTIQPDETKPCDDSFKLTVSPDTPDQTEIELTLDITSAEGGWAREFSLLVEAPVLELADCVIDDGVGGDGDGLAEPGESIDLVLQLNNTGHEDARSVTGVLSSPSGYVQINQNTAAVGLVAEGGSADLVGYNLTIRPECPEMTTVELELDVTADLGYAISFSWPLPVAPFLDDFEADQGWTASGTASTGMWERADPEGTTYNGGDCQPEDDHTPAPGKYCWVTGPLAGTGAGDYDVDGGYTVLTSPLFDLSGAGSASVEYWRWYTNNLGYSPGEDWWSVEVTDDGGAGWVYLERTQASANYWQKMTFVLEDYIQLTDQVRFRFTAEDTGGGSLVEAAVDDFLLSATQEAATEVAREETPFVASPGFQLLPNRPNPFNPSTLIHYRLDAAEGVRTTLKIYDPRGRLVTTLVDADQAAGDYTVVWDGRGARGHAVASGVYFCVLKSGENNRTRELVLLK